MALTKIDDRGVTYPLDLLDNEKIRFGTGNDLEIFHTGSHSNITDSGTGNLNINSSQVNIHNVAINEPMARFIENDAVKLYFDSSEKLVTESTGVAISGSLSFGDGSGAGGSNKISFGASDDLNIFHDGGHSYIKDTGTGNLNLVGSIVDITNAAETEFQARFIEDGAVELYHNGTKKFESLSSGVRAQGGICFGSDTAADNHLNDYEHGTFTPTWNTDSASVTIGYHTQKGFYVKIGRMVYFQVYIRLNSSGAVSGGSGALAVHGLPFTPQNATSSDNVAYGTANIGYTNSWPGDQADRALVSSGSAKCYVYVGQSSGTNVVAGAGNLGNDTQFRASGSYVAA